MNLLILLLYRVSALISYIPKKLIAENNENNIHKLVNITSDYIENQSDYSNISFGKRDLSYCGCGAIATYNALISLKNVLSKADLSKIISYYENKGLVFGGKFGISPTYVKKYFKKLGYQVRTTFSSTQTKLDEFGKMYDTFICTMYNSKKNIGKGLHYICITKDNDGTFISHNPYYKSHSLSNLITKASSDNGKSLYMIGVSHGKDNN